MTSEDVYSEPTVRPKDGDGTVYQLTTTVDQTQVSETAERQDSDPQLVEMKKYLVKGELPLDEEKALPTFLAGSNTNTLSPSVMRGSLAF